jgi:hypothetical protein
VPQGSAADWIESLKSLANDPRQTGAGRCVSGRDHRRCRLHRDAI